MNKAPFIKRWYIHKNISSPSITGEMILQTCVFLVLSVAWGVSGVSYSNVFVQTGPEPAPAVEYYSGYPYNLEYASPQIAQYKTPVKYEYPFSSSSYGYSSGTALAEPVAAVSAPPTPSVVYPAYSAPTANLFGGRNEPNGYEYALVYLPSSGAELKQLNEGEVVRGGYSFLQPDQVVQYVTDNNQGFNAFFKNYLPGGEVKHIDTAHHETSHQETPHHETAHHEAAHHEIAHNLTPCQVAKNAALTAADSHHEHHVEDPEERHGGHEHHEAHEEHEHSHPAEHEGRHAEHEVEPVEHEGHHADHEGHNADHEARTGGHETTAPHEHDSHESEPHHEHNIIIKIQEGRDSENDEPTVEIEHHVHAHTEHDKHEDAEETPTPDSDEHAHTHENIVENQHAGHETAVAVAPKYPVAGNNVFISYDDFIKCIRSALARGNTQPYYAPVPKPVSPLTYLVLNKPC